MAWPTICTVTSSTAAKPSALLTTTCIDLRFIKVHRETVGQRERIARTRRRGDEHGKREDCAGATMELAPFRERAAAEFVYV